MSSSAGPIGLVLTVAAVFSAGVLWTAGVTQLGGERAGSSVPPRTASVSCDTWVFPYVQRDCRPADGAAVLAAAPPKVPAGDVSHAAMTVAAASSNPKAPAETPLPATLGTGSVRNPEAAGPVMSDAALRDPVKPAPAQYAENASPTPAAPLPPRPVEPAASPLPKPEVAKAAEPAAVPKARKPVEPITVQRSAERPAPVERTEPPARNVRVIPIDRTYLATVPPTAPGAEPAPDGDQPQQPVLAASRGPARAPHVAAPASQGTSTPAASLDPARTTTEIVTRAPAGPLAVTAQSAVPPARSAAPGDAAVSTLLSAQQARPVTTPGAVAPLAPAGEAATPAAIVELKPAPAAPAQAAAPAIETVPATQVAAVPAAHVPPSAAAPVPPSPTQTSASPPANESREPVAVTSLQPNAAPGGPAIITVPDGAKPDPAAGGAQQPAPERRLTARERRELARAEQAERLKAERAVKEAERVRLAAEAEQAAKERAARLEIAKAEAETKRQAERAAKEAERVRLAAEAEQAAKERAERLEIAKAEAETKRQAERAAKEAERARLAAEAEQAAKERAARLEIAKAEAQRAETERAARQAAAQAEADTRRQAERATKEAERVRLAAEAEQAAKERAARLEIAKAEAEAKRQAERAAKEAERVRLAAEAERTAKERAARRDAARAELDARRQAERSHRDAERARLAAEAEQVARDRTARREAARAEAEARRNAERQARAQRRQAPLEAYDPNYRYGPPRGSRSYGEWVYPDAPVRSRSYVERRRYYTEDAPPRGYYVRRQGPGGILGWLSGD